MDKPIKIAAKNISKVYNSGTGNAIHAINALDLDVWQGEFVSLLGPSGCGKSTFLYMVGGFEEITEGELFLDGKLIEGPGSNRGIVFQEYVLFPWQTVSRNIEYGLRIKKVSAKDRKARVDELVRMIGLQGYEDVFPHFLSGGMQQRVAIARAMAYNPDVLLMDEPFGALDAQTRSRMIDDLIEVHKQTKKTILFVTHSVEEALLLSDRVCLFSARPSHIKKIYEIDMERPRVVTDERFVRYQRELLADLSVEVSQMMSEGQDST